MRGDIEHLSAHDLEAMGVPPEALGIPPEGKPEGKGAEAAEAGEQQPRFEKRQQVKVRRTDGRTEEGWEVFVPRTEDGRVGVRKGAQVKFPKVEDLERWQQETAARFEQGQLVRVERSGGQVEEGWEVLIPRTEDGRVVVGKGKLRKGVRPEKLAEWQQQKAA